MVEDESEKRTRWIIGKIEQGEYRGRTIKVKFGKPLKVLCAGKDITDVVMELHVSLTSKGQTIAVKIAELDYSQYKG